jgi:hypothetical protein
MAEQRGRKKVILQEVKEKYSVEWFDYPSKPELGCRYVWHYDKTKSINPIKTETFYPKDFKPKKIKADKGKAYSKQPVVMVFKSSNRSNAKVKLKVWNNENIDYIISAKKLPGVPETSIILELGVGGTFIDEWKLKYNL